MLKRLTVCCFMLLYLSLCGCKDYGTPTGTQGSESGQKQEAPVRIADTLDLAVCEPERSIKTFQDIASFLGRRIEIWNDVYRNLELEEEERAAVQEYVSLLVKEFDFEIVDSYHYDATAEDAFGRYFLDGTWEVCLGLATVDTGREERGQHTKTPCDINLYCKNGELKMWFSDLFHTEDFGFRRSDGEADRFNEVYGQRVLDAYCLGNGRYYNESDSVLSVEAGTKGEAVVLVNGEKALYSTDAGIYNEIYADYACDDYRIEINDFLDGVEGEEILITVPKTLMGGEVYTLSDGLGERGDSPIWAIYSPGEGEVVRSSDAPTPRAAMNACTVRVLQWNEVECVVYIAMDMVTELESMTIETLAVMPAYGSLWGDSFKESEAISLKVGESLELKYDSAYVFMPNYETYKWEITSGQGASISGYSDTCTVTGVSAGEIVIKCVYSYGKDEPDVLTGILRNENHTKSKIYYVKIIP